MRNVSKEQREFEKKMRIHERICRMKDIKKKTGQSMCNLRG